MNEVAKYHRYFVYDSSNRFIREWTDMVSEFRHTDEVNTFGSDLTIRLGRSVRNLEVELGYLQDEDGNNILDENSQPIITETTATVNVGEGTDVEINNGVKVYEYYGSTDTLLDENGDPILDENSFPIITEKGALEGRPVFCGYIDSYQADETEDGSNIVVNVAPMAADYANLIFENYFWSFTQNVTGTQAYTLLAKQNGTDTYAAVQTLVGPATGEYLRAVTAYRFPANAHLFGLVTITIKLYTGSDPNAARTLLHTYNSTIDASLYSGQTVGFATNINDGPSLTSGSPYHLEVTVDADKIGSTFPIEIVRTNGGYSSGSFWTATGASTTYVEDTGTDMYFIFDSLTARETKATYSGWNLADFVDQTIDLVLARGGRVRPNNPESNHVEDPGGIAPDMEFNVDTYKERLDTAIRLSPPGWYYRYDHATNSIWFQPRHETPDHVLVAGVHLQAVEPVYDATQIVNTVYFTGGKTDPNDADSPNLFIRRADPVSVQRYGVKAIAISDARYHDPASIETRVEYELTKQAYPVWRTTVVVLDKVYDISTIFVGQTVGFNGFGTFVDDLVLQVIRKQTQKGKAVLTLGALPPTERKRLAELKQALDRIAAQDNDVSPD